ERSRNPRAMRRAFGRAVSGSNGRSRAKRNQPPGDEDFREAEIRRLHTNNGRARWSRANFAGVSNFACGRIRADRQESALDRSRRAFRRERAGRNAAGVPVIAPCPERSRAGLTQEQARENKPGNSTSEQSDDGDLAFRQQRLALSVRNRDFAVVL